MSIARNLHQDVTYWVTTPDGYGGWTFGAPVHLKGRWEEKTEEFMDKTGAQAVSQAVVYLDTDVEVDDYLFNGFSNEVNPSLLKAYQIRRFDKSPDLRSVSFIRKAFL